MPSRSLARTLTPMLLLLSLFAFGGGAGSASTAPVPVAPPTEPGAVGQSEHGPPDAASLMAGQFGISDDEARHRLAREPAISQLQADARQTLGRDFAGLWVDQEHGGVVHIAAAADRPADFVALRNSFDSPDLLQITVVQRSLADLEDLQARLLKLDIGGTPSIDLASNRIEFMPSRPLTAADRGLLSRTGRPSTCRTVWCTRCRTDLTPAPRRNHG